jgi:serine phosphatase RsbU (regulator of sigma subunit)
MEEMYGRILSIDDETILRESIVAYLEDSGFEVYEACNGQEGLEVFREEKPDLVLSDLQMPIMGGLEVLQEIRKESPETPVIVVSGAGVMDDAIEALRLGAWDYLVKPVTDMAVLEHAVCKALEKKRLIQENMRIQKELEVLNTQLKDNLATLEEDQEAGRSVQVKLLPEKQLNVGPYEISHKVLPSLYLSGDCVDYFDLDDERFVFYIADVSGHGASAAFVTVLVKSIISDMHSRYRAEGDETLLDPAKVMSDMSREILGAKLGKYLTMLYFVLHKSTNKIDYCIGGHYPNPVIYDGKTCKLFEGTGFPVGIFDKAKYENKEMQLPEHFSLVMFSDGIMEVIEGELVEKEATLLRTIEESDLTVEDLFDRYHIDQTKEQLDDISIMILKK